MVNALNVANNILNKGFSENIDITPMKLQKLTYLVYKNITRIQRVHYFLSHLKYGNMDR